MGGAQSSSSNGSAAGEDEAGLKDLESKFRGTGDLAILERAFSHLTASSSESSSSKKHPTIPSLSLQAAFGLAPIAIEDSSHPELSQVISHIGSAIVKEFFDTENKQEISWFQLLRGFQKCSQTSGGNGLKLLFSVYSQATQITKGPSQSKVLEKAPLGSGTYFDMVGYLTGAQLRDFFWLCWLLMCSARLPSSTAPPRLQAFLPKIDSLLSGAITGCDVSKSKDASFEQGGLDKELPVMEISPWVLTMTPGLGDCLAQYIRSKLERVPTTTTTDSVEEEEETDPTATEPAALEDPDTSEGASKPHEMLEKNTLVLQSGVAWAIGLSLRDASSEILFRAACGLTSSEESEYPYLMYRSSVHGRGMNRFWTCVQGYRGLTLFLISAVTKVEGSEDITQEKKAVVGALIAGGFDNKESFYGASGSCLFALDPMFLPIHSTGREKNFVYSHKNTPGAGYRGQPKPEGVGFGGSSGKERIWVNEEFGTLTVRHHAVDKTYQAGSLLPNQGYAPIVAKILEIEVWGLGGKSAEEDQAKYLKRENLFSEQRRKVDLKTMFGTWGNSPEKMMMDMVSDPNGPAREER